MHDFCFIIHLSKRQTFQSEKYLTMDACMRMCEKKLRELHINHSDGVELEYIDEHGDKWRRKSELEEVMP